MTVLTSQKAPQAFAQKGHILMGRMLRLILTSLFACAAACGTQQGANYNGDPVASLHGNVVDTGKEPLSAQDLKVSVMWEYETPENQFEFMDGHIEGQFPAKFTLDMLSPPPDKVLLDASFGGKYPDEARIGVGVIVAIPATLSAAPSKNDIRGAAENFMLVYVDRDVRPGTISSVFLHGTPNKGYHLMDVVRLSPADKAAAKATFEACLPERDSRQSLLKCGYDPHFDQLVPAPLGEATNIEIRLAPKNDLKLPHWK